MEKISLTRLAREFGLEKESVKSALEAAGIKWEQGPRNSHLFPAAQARAVLGSKRDIMAQIREQRLGVLTAQRELAEQKRDDYNRTHITLKDHFFVLAHVAAGIHRWLYSLELPFPKEIAAGHDLIAEQLEAWRVIGLDKESIEQKRKELARARRCLEKAIKDGLMHDRATGQALPWLKIPTDLRMSLYVRDDEEIEDERRMLAATNGNTG
jgi:hypothetical protein